MISELITCLVFVFVLYSKWMEEDDSEKKKKEEQRRKLDLLRIRIERFVKRQKFNENYRITRI